MRPPLWKDLLSSSLSFDEFWESAFPETRGSEPLERKAYLGSSGGVVVSAGACDSLGGDVVSLGALELSGFVELPCGAVVDEAEPRAPASAESSFIVSHAASDRAAAAASAPAARVFMR